MFIPLVQPCFGNTTSDADPENRPNYEIDISSRTRHTKAETRIKLT